MGESYSKVYVTLEVISGLFYTIMPTDLVVGFEHSEYTVREGRDTEAEVCVVIYEPGQDSLDDSLFASVLLVPADDNDTAQGK